MPFATASRQLPTMFSPKMLIGLSTPGDVQSKEVLCFCLNLGEYIEGDFPGHFAKRTQLFAENHLLSRKSLSLLEKVLVVLLNLRALPKLQLMGMAPAARGPQMRAATLGCLQPHGTEFYPRHSLGAVVIFSTAGRVKQIAL
jgi:hypothetical protein